MNTNFGTLNTGIVATDYGLFTIGTKREEMEDMESSIFYNPLKKFDRTDKNKNGVIEADELLSRIKKLKIGTIAFASFQAMMTVILGCCSYKCFKQLSPIIGFAAGISGVLMAEFSIRSFSGLPLINKYIELLEEYVNREQAQKTDA